MRRRVVGLAAVAAWIVLLSACATLPGPSVAPVLSPAQRAAAEAAQQVREARLRAQPVWSLSGRIAVSVGTRGGSGRLDWVQSAGRYEVALSAPVTRQSWRLSGTEGAASLEGLEGGTREGPDAAQLLREATGWEIPVAQLPDWVRGLRAPLADARVDYGTDGRVLRIEQSGWTIEYPEWRVADAGRPDLPRRVIARNGDAMVRLVVDEWSL